MKREYIDYVNDILDSINKVESFTVGLSVNDFAKDEKTIYAVIRALEIIGEAVKKIPDDVKVQYNEIPWNIIAKMRDKLIHDYFGINIEVIWKTIKEDIPSIKPLIKKISEEK